MVTTYIGGLFPFINRDIVAVLSQPQVQMLLLHQLVNYTIDLTGGYKLSDEQMYA
jgi:hypothetical protein